MKQNRLHSFWALLMKTRFRTLITTLTATAALATGSANAALVADWNASADTPGILVWKDQTGNGNDLTFVSTANGTTADDTDLVVGRWTDGRIGTFRGHRRGPHGYGATVFGSDGIGTAGRFEGYEPLLVEIATFFRTGRPPVSEAETLEILAFMEAAEASAARGGSPVPCHVPPAIGGRP